MLFAYFSSSFSVQASSIHIGRPKGMNLCLSLCVCVCLSVLTRTFMLFLIILLYLCVSEFMNAACSAAVTRTGARTGWYSTAFKFAYKFSTLKKKAGESAALMTLTREHLFVHMQVEQKYFKHRWKLILFYMCLPSWTYYTHRHTQTNTIEDWVIAEHFSTE